MRTLMPCCAHVSFLEYISLGLEHCTALISQHHSRFANVCFQPHDNDDLGHIRLPNARDRCFSRSVFFTNDVVVSTLKLAHYSHQKYQSRAPRTCCFLKKGRRFPGFSGHMAGFWPANGHNRAQKWRGFPTPKPCCKILSIVRRSSQTFHRPATPATAVTIPEISKMGALFSP